MDVTNHSPDSFAAQPAESYPLHFSLRDIYARFKENPGFQQTPGLIRPMQWSCPASGMPTAHARSSGFTPNDLDLNGGAAVRRRECDVDLPRRGQLKSTVALHWRVGAWLGRTPVLASTAWWAGHDKLGIASRSRTRADAANETLQGSPWAR